MRMSSLDSPDFMDVATVREDTVLGHLTYYLTNCFPTPEQAAEAASIVKASLDTCSFTVDTERIKWDEIKRRLDEGAVRASENYD